MRLSTGFEGARIEVLELTPRGARVAIPHDQASPRFRQWFAFDLEAPPGREVELVFDNAAACTWGDAFGGDYRVYASRGQAWHRVDTRVGGGRMTVRFSQETPRTRLAYYPPYPASRLALLRRHVRKAGGEVELLGSTPAGRPIERYSFGSRTAPAPPVWLIAQQHPGEAMAGWLVEGLVLGLAQGGLAARRLLERAQVSIVPRMNPDGAAVGNHRTTALGVDLNRSWQLSDAPVEVRVVRDKMKALGVSTFIDAHGDERLPWVFAQAADAYRDRPARIGDAIARFEAAMLAATPDYQTEHKYPYDASGTPSLMFASNWVQQEFGCPALTLEMPFSDHRGRPHARGFFPARARRLGQRLILGLSAALGA